MGWVLWWKPVVLRYGHRQRRASEKERRTGWLAGRGGVERSIIKQQGRRNQAEDRQGIRCMQ